MPRYELYADEAWTHQSPPLRRYWCFYGGVFGAEADLGRLDTALRACAARGRIHGEVKWQNDGLRAIDAKTRGSRAFNWFESTGKDGDRENLLNHQVRIWKFLPRQYMVDAGWHRKHLGAAGAYRGQQIGPTVRTTAGWATY